MLLNEQTVFNLIFSTVFILTGRYGYYASIEPVEFAQAGMAAAKVERRSFNTNAVNSRTGAKGLFQVLDSTKAWVEKKFLSLPVAPVSKMFDPEYNSMIGLAYLGYLYKRFGDWERAVTAYHDGPNRDGISEAGKAYLSLWKKFYNAFDFDRLMSPFDYAAYAYYSTERDFYIEFP